MSHVSYRIARPHAEHGLLFNGTICAGRIDAARALAARRDPECEFPLLIRISRDGGREILENRTPC